MKVFVNKFSKIRIEGFVLWDAALCLSSRSEIKDEVWLQAVQYSAEFDSRQCDTLRSWTPGSAILCGVWLQAVRYSAEFDSRQCDTPRSLTSQSLKQPMDHQPRLDMCHCAKNTRKPLINLYQVILTTYCFSV